MTTDRERIEALKEVCRKAIRALYRLGVSQVELSEITGLGKHVVYSLVRNVERLSTPSCCRLHNSGIVSYPKAEGRPPGAPRSTMTVEEEAAWLTQMSQ